MVSSQSNQPSQPSKVSDDTISVLNQIKELAKLHNDGILTEEEFAAKKSELLERI